MKKVAFIVGSDGQDGKILYSKINQTYDSIILINKNNFDLSKELVIQKLIKKHKPSNIFYFAAYHNSAEEEQKNNFFFIKNSYEVNYKYPLYFLQAIDKFHKECKFFFASSSLIFKPSKLRVNENSIRDPREIYSYFKNETMKLCKYYRDNKNIFVNVGILFNHESEYRKNTYLSKKIILHAIKNYNGSKKKLILGNLNSFIDWSYAYDIIDAILLMNNLKKSSDFIICSGKKYSIKNFVEYTYSYLGLNYKKYVKLDKKILFRKPEIRIGNYSKLNKATGWRPKTNLKEMIEKIVDSQIK